MRAPGPTTILKSQRQHGEDQLHQRVEHTKRPQTATTRDHRTREVHTACEGRAARGVDATIISFAATSVSLFSFSPLCVAPSTRQRPVAMQPRPREVSGGPLDGQCECDCERAGPPEPCVAERCVSSTYTTTMFAPFTTKPHAIDAPHTGRLMREPLKPKPLKTELRQCHALLMTTTRHACRDTRHNVVAPPATSNGGRVRCSVERICGDGSAVGSCRRRGLPEVL